MLGLSVACGRSKLRKLDAVQYSNIPARIFFTKYGKAEDRVHVPTIPVITVPTETATTVEVFMANGALEEA